MELPAPEAVISNRRDRTAYHGSYTPADPKGTEIPSLPTGEAGQEGRGEGSTHLNRAGHGQRRRGSRAPRQLRGGSTAPERRRRSSEGRLPEPSGDLHAFWRKFLSASPSQRRKRGELFLLRFPSPHQTASGSSTRRRARAHLQWESVERDVARGQRGTWRAGLSLKS